VIISKDEFRSRFATTEGRLALGYPHVDSSQASAVVANDAVLDATYDGWVKAQESLPEAQRFGAAQTSTAPGQYGQPAPGYGSPTQSEPPAYGQPAPGSAQQFSAGQYPGQNAGAPYGGQPGQQYPQSPYGGAQRYQGTQQAPSMTGPLVLAIIGVIVPFVAFAVGFVSWIGLILGIMALRRVVPARRMIPVGTPGRGTATAAFVLAIIAIVFGGLSVITWITSYVVH
jgi:hypothetical protein